MQLPLLLAYRFLKSASSEQSISTMLKICFISIVISTGSLTLIASIMNGFEAETHKKLQGVHADLMIHSHQGSINYEKLSTVLRTEYADTIKASSPTSIHHVILETRVQTLEEPYGTSETSICLLKAIDPVTEPQVSTVGDMITQGSGDPWQSLDEESIFIGEALAKRLKVSVGSQVTLLYQSDASTSQDEVSLERKKVIIAALFKTGIHDFDEQVIIAPFSLVDELYSHEITHVALSLQNPRQTSRIKASLQKRLHLEVYSWKDLYPPLVSALTLEKYAMWFILMLVTLVASLTIIALLYMYTKHKEADIALLKAMGMANNELKKIFLCIAGLITLGATLVGIALATVGTLLLQRFPFITLPDVYYVTHLPAQLDITIIFAVLIFACIVSLCAGLFPNSTLKSMRITEILKGLQS